MGELFHTLGIEWSVLVAQMINFGILMLVLAKFVYKPVLNVIDERRRIVAESVEKAKEIDRQKERMDHERTVVLRKADEEAGALLRRAKEEADANREESDNAARIHAEQVVAKGMQQLENERAKVMRDIQDRLAHAIVLSAEKILRREFSAEDQQAFESELKENLPTLLP